MNQYKKNQNYDYNIELTGLPGSGKSYIVNELIKFRSCLKYKTAKTKCGEIKYGIKLKQNKLQWTFPYIPNLIRKRKAKKYYNFRFNREETNALINFTEENNHFSLKVNDIINQYKKNARDAFLFARWFQTIMIDHKLIENNLKKDETILFEEGFVQKLVGLNLNFDITSEDIKDYIYLSPRPKIIIYIHAPLETIQNRLEKRGWPGWMQTRRDITRSQLLSRTRDKINEICEEYNRKKVPILYIENNSEDVQENLNAITNLINRVS